ncbi:MAG TPA: response regulator [Candidatus Cloacimonetes bacterium]|nr:response regulator [Candidatus Cloacimonadota bacterium]HEX37274.1 response regulator [Candidatus Cloacimonadota bacterium]
MDKLDISVLFAEDQILILQSMANILKRHVRDVYTATNGQEGLELYKQHKPDILIVDIHMPVMNGLEMVRIIKSIDPTIRVILLSAFDNKEYLLDAIRMRVNGFLSKPVNSEKLIGIITDMYENIQLKQKVKEEEEKKNIALDLLRESERNYKALYKMLRLMCDNVPDMIWAKNKKGEYLFANKAICDKLLNAKDTEEPIGKTDMFFAQRERESHSENPEWHTFDEICANSDDVTLKVNRSKRFEQFGNVKGEFMILDVHKAPFIDDKGEVIGTVGCGRIVTEERELEKKYKRILKQYEPVAENISDIITLHDVDDELTLLYCTPSLEKFIGWELKDVLNKSALLHAYPEDVKKLKVVAAKVSKGEIAKEQWRVFCKDGSYKKLETVFNPIKDQKGLIKNVLCSSRVISDEKK